MLSVIKYKWYIYHTLYLYQVYNNLPFLKKDQFVSQFDLKVILFFTTMLNTRF